MMGLDSALVILLAEALAVLVAMILVIWYLSRRRRNREFAAIDQFIDQLEESAALKNKPLDQMLTGCGLTRDEVDGALQEITDSERALFQQIIQLFLQREMAVLGNIDQCIGELSEPYCRIIGSMAGGSGNTSSPTDSNPHSSGLERVNQQLVRQLDTAMQTIDEITAEYTRVFSGQQTALELDNSRKKMLQIFQDAEHQIRESAQS